MPHKLMNLLGTGSSHSPHLSRMGHLMSYSLTSSTHQLIRFKKLSCPSLTLAGSSIWLVPWPERGSLPPGGCILSLSTVPARTWMAASPCLLVLESTRHFIHRTNCAPSFSLRLDRCLGLQMQPPCSVPLHALHCPLPGGATCPPLWGIYMCASRSFRLPGQLPAAKLGPAPLAHGCTPPEPRTGPKIGVLLLLTFLFLSTQDPGRVFLVYSAISPEVSTAPEQIPLERPWPLIYRLLGAAWPGRPGLASSYPDPVMPR